MKTFFVEDTEDHLTEAGASNGTKVVPGGTVFLLTRGMTLLNEVPICVSQRPMAFNQDVKAVTVKDGLLTRFLPYLLLGNKAQLLNMVDLAGHGTGRLNTSQLEALPVMVPPAAEQHAIAESLGALDDKIELNRKMNATLDELARTIFRSWFIDFDPVHAKGEVRTPFGMDAETAALFPDRFTDSELGLIPDGWSVARLDEILLLQRGFDLPTDKRVPGPVPVVAASGINGCHSEAKVKGPGVVTGRSGVIGNVYYVDEDFWPLNTALWVKEFRHATPMTAFMLLRNLDLSHFGTGSAVPTLNRNHIHGNSVVKPDMRVIYRYEEIARPLIELMRSNREESRTLAELRDTLLPELISGRIRVPDAENAVAEVV